MTTIGNRLSKSTPSPSLPHRDPERLHTDEACTHPHDRAYLSLNGRTRTATLSVSSDIPWQRAGCKMSAYSRNEILTIDHHNKIKDHNITKTLIHQLTYIHYYWQDHFNKNNPNVLGETQIQKTKSSILAQYCERDVHCMCVVCICVVVCSRLVGGSMERRKSRLRYKNVVKKG